MPQIACARHPEPAAIRHPRSVLTAGSLWLSWCRRTDGNARSCRDPCGCRPRSRARQVVTPDDPDGRAETSLRSPGAGLIVRPAHQRLLEFGEDFTRHCVAVECPSNARVDGHLNERLDDLLLGHTVVQGDAQLTSERLKDAEARRDGDRDEGASSRSRCSPRPRIVEACSVASQ